MASTRAKKKHVPRPLPAVEPPKIPTNPIYDRLVEEAGYDPLAHTGLAPNSTRKKQRGGPKRASQQEA